MSSVDIASNYAEQLVERERRATGKLDSAMENVARSAGLSKWSIWGLWHGRRKTGNDTLVGRLRGALIRQLEAEIRRLEHDLTILKATSDRPDDWEILEVQTTLAKLRKTLGLAP